MVPLVKRRHFALEPDPERESRLLAFAAGTTPDPNAQPQAPTAAPESEAADLLPDATPENIESQQNVLRGGVQNVLGGPQRENSDSNSEQQNDQAEIIKREAMRKNFESTLEIANTAINKMYDVQNRMKDELLMAKMRMFASSDVVRNWEMDMKAVEEELEQSGKEKLFIEAMSALWEGEMPPERFNFEQSAYLQNLPFGSVGFTEMGAKINEAVEQDNLGAGDERKFSAEAWPTLNESSRMEIVDGFLKNVNMDEFLTQKKEQNRKMEKAMKKYELWLTKMESDMNAAEATKEAEKGHTFRNSLRKIRFYSINDYINGFQKYGAALKSTWEQRSERYSADIARKIGQKMAPFNFIPFYGQEVEQILDQQLDAKSNEEAEAVKKQLENDKSKWGAIFMKPHGEFWKWAGKNANKTRGVLEYAAEHGFLYDIDEEATSHDQPICGMKLADLCYDWQAAGDTEKIHNYFTSLRGKNASGREHEMDHGYKMEHDVENVPKFIRLLEHEMDEDNLWAAAGICKRAMERGLEGEVAAWLFTTVMDKLRERTELRAVTPVAFFDIIGKLSMYSTAFTLGWAKGYRNQLRQWAKTGDENILNNTELKYMPIIQNDIKKMDPATNYDTPEGHQKMNRILAKVLAGHIVDLPGGYLNIYETRFASYRKTVHKMFASVADPSKEDPDFAREDTEKGMLPNVVIKKILKYNSTFEFTSEDWVEPYLGNLISMANRLQNIPELKDAHANYCHEIREKMDLFFGSFMKKEDRASKQLSTQDPTTGKPAIASLVASNLLSWDVMKQAKCADELAEQLQEHFGEFYHTVVVPGKSTPK